MQPSTRDLFFFGLAQAIVLFAVWLFCTSIPGFQAMFAAVADRLPEHSRLIFSGYLWSLLTPGVVIFFWLFPPFKKYRGVLALASSVLCSALLLLVMRWAASQPELILEIIARG
jgi:hypothetical protein